MKKELLLVLCFYEGQGFCPKEENKVLLSARIDSSNLSIDPVPQTSEPKFCTEVSWTIDHQTLRRYKLSRVPVRVECHCFNKNNESQSLGYIILTLSSVVQGIETDPKWYKLLGGNLTQSKVPPQILLSLNLHLVNPDAKIKGDSPRMLHNGSMHGLQYGNGPVGSATNNHIMQQNGTAPHPYQDANMNSHMSLSQRETFHLMDFEGPSKLGALLSDRSHVLTSSSPKDIFRTPLSGAENKSKVESGSSKSYGDEFSQSQHIDLEDDDSDEVCKIDTIYAEEADEEMPHPHEGPHNTQEMRIMDRVDALASESIRENDLKNCNGRVEYKFTPTSPVEKVRNLLDGITTGREGLNKSQTSEKLSENVDNFDIYSGMDDEVLDSGFQSRFNCRAREGWSASRPSMHHSIGDLEQDFAAENKGIQSGSQNKYETKRVSDPLSSAFVDEKQNYIPVKIIKGHQSGVQSSSGRNSLGISDHLVPHLDHEGGFIQIGPAGDAGERSFEFSVTIVFAKNLEQLLPRDYVWSPNSGVCFSYSLMGCVITSDQVDDLYNPDFLAERVAGNIRATASNLSAYFKKHPEFPIHLLIGDMCLASASISLTKFQNFDSRSITQVPVMLEGWYQLKSVMSDSGESVPGKEPVLGVVMQLCGQSTKSPHHVPSTVSNSASSESEIDQSEFPIHCCRRLKTGKVKYSNRLDPSSVTSTSEEDLILDGKKFRSTIPQKMLRNKKSLLNEFRALRDLSDEGNKLRRHLFKAALEVESWKEDQQALFLKQWSAREAELQQYLSEEWKSRINDIESKLHSRLAQSDALNKKLTAALSELTIREKKLSSKEERVRKLLRDLEIQKHEQEEAEKGTFEGRLKQRERTENDSLLDELKKGKERTEQLESEVHELKLTLAQVQMPPHLQHHEMKKQIISLEKEKELMGNDLAAALQKKQYYKVQWVRSVSELHHLKKSRLYDVETLRSQMEMSSPEPYYRNPHHHKRHKSKSHAIDRGMWRSKQMPSRSRRKSGKATESLLSAKTMESQGMPEPTAAEPGCSWMDQAAGWDVKRNRVEQRASGMSRNRTEDRTVEIGKGRRTSIGNNTSDYDEYMWEKSNEESFGKLIKDNTVWKIGEK